MESWGTGAGFQEREQPCCGLGGGEGGEQRPNGVA